MHKSIRSVQKKRKEKHTHKMGRAIHLCTYNRQHANNNGIIFDNPIKRITNPRKKQHKYKNERICNKFCVCCQRRYTLSNFSRISSAIVYVFYINVHVSRSNMCILSVCYEDGVLVKDKLLAVA